MLFFPEGTTTDGSEVLPFRRGLYNSVVYDDVPVQAVAVGYRLDEPNPGATVGGDVCYWGEMVFGPHVFRCLGLRGVHTHIRFGARIAGADRFALAVNSRDEVERLYEGLAREQAATAQAGEGLFDRPVEGLGAFYDQGGARG